MTHAPVRHFFAAKHNQARWIAHAENSLVVELRATYQVRACCWLPCGGKRPLQEGAVLGLVQGCRGGVSMQLLHVGLSSLLRAAAAHMESYRPPVPAVIHCLLRETIQ